MGKTYEIVATIILVIVITLVFTIKSKKYKDSSWVVEVIKKKVYSDEDNENHVYKLFFKTQEGKRYKVNVDENTYNQTNIGDKFQKIKGEYLPKKI
mgnify:CR=1 FL=1